MTTETLAPDIAWDPSGHLSEVALSVAADGEDALLDAAMHEHLAACDTCTIELGNVALRAARVSKALLDPRAASLVRDVRQSLPSDVRQSLPSTVAQALPIGASWMPPSSVRASSPDLVKTAARRKIPMAALVPALLVAALGAVPSLLHVPAQVTQTWSVLREVGPSFVRVAPLALAKAWNGPRGTLVVMVVWALAAMLVAAGMGIAKQQSKKLLVDGGRR